MREIIGVAQETSDTRRRWFHDDYFDLFVWQASHASVTAFELYYGLSSSERALVWRQNTGYFHDGVPSRGPDSNEVLGAHAGGSPASDPVIQRFEAAAGGLPEDVRGPITSLVRDYAEQQPATMSRRKKVHRADWQKSSR